MMTSSMKLVTATIDESDSDPTEEESKTVSESVSHTALFSDCECGEFWRQYIL